MFGGAVMGAQAISRSSSVEASGRFCVQVLSRGMAVLTLWYFLPNQCQSQLSINAKLDYAQLLQVAGTTVAFL